MKKIKRLLIILGISVVMAGVIVPCSWMYTQWSGRNVVETGDIKTKDMVLDSDYAAETMFKETSSPTETPEPTEEPVKTVNLTFTGDLMVHNYQYEAAYDSKKDKYDFSNNFKYVKKYLESADYTIGNLETTLAGRERGISGYPTFNSPDSFASEIKESGYDLLTTANNHCVDKGVQGLERTIDVLSDLGFDQIGTYKSKKKSKEIFVKEISGIKIAFLSCTYGTNGITYEGEYHVQLLNESF